MTKYKYWGGVTTPHEDKKIQIFGCANHLKGQKRSKSDILELI